MGRERGVGGFFFIVSAGKMLDLRTLCKKVMAPFLYLLTCDIGVYMHPDRVRDKYTKER